MDLSRAAREAASADQNTYPTERDELAAAVQRLTDTLSDQLRQTQSDGLWASIPTFVQEHIYTPSLPINTPLMVPPVFSTLVVIRNVVVCVPPGAVATLQLGSDVFPALPAGVQSFSLNKLLNATDTRTVIITGNAGPVAVALHGNQLAPEGSVSL